MRSGSAAPPIEQVLTASAISASLASGLSRMSCIAVAKASHGLQSPSSSLYAGPSWSERDSQDQSGMCCQHQESGEWKHFWKYMSAAHNNR